MEKIITYFEKPMKVGCDEKCNKAWGSIRPFIKLSDEDVDDIVFLSDEELGDAPEDTGRYEGGHAKPVDKKHIPNKWCVRECERCARSPYNKPKEPLIFIDWSKRVYNIPSKHQ
jgi:hypothetical protein